MEATMHEAKTNLSKLVARARAGEEVILTAWDGYNDGRSPPRAD